MMAYLSCYNLFNAFGSVRFEIGRKLVNSSWFRFAFLTRGENDAFFRLDGIMALVMDMLTILVITVIKS